MISVVDLHMHFGGIRAVDGTSLRIDKGSITGLIGPNGAGKTTLFNVVAGAYQPTSGKVYLDGEDVTGLQPHQLFKKGLLRTFQIAHEFSSLTVLENLMMVPDEQPGECLRDAWFRNSLVQKHERQVRDKAREVIEFLEISHLEKELAGNLSGGQKKLLELAPRRTSGRLELKRVATEKDVSLCALLQLVHFVWCVVVVVVARANHPSHAS